MPAAAKSPVKQRDVAELNDALGDAKRDYDLSAKTKVLTICADVDLAATALTMIPRPKWVAEIVGERVPDTLPD